MTIEEKRRELFEAWYAKRYGSRENSAWARAEFCDAWEVWCAALDAVVIELPDCTEFDSPSGAMPAIDGCRDAIESTGLGLKVKS